MSEHPHITPSTQWHARATAVLPGGGFGNFPPEMILERGKGGRVWDVDGNEYVDFLLGSGPMFIGHCHPEVSAAVDAQLALGTTFFANNSSGIALAEDIVAALPAAEQVRFVSSGTEADMYAMRLVRAYRKRELILKFEGGYHGMSDHALMSLAPKRLVNLPRPVPDLAGICGHVEDEVLVAPFNDIDAAVKLIASHADQLAGVIVEPLQRLIPPKPGFLEALRAETEARDIPLIFDEVVTGFRFGHGGAQSLYGVTRISAPLVKSLAAVSLWAPSPDAPTSWPTSTPARSEAMISCYKLVPSAVIRWPPSPVERPSKSCAKPMPMPAPKPPETRSWPPSPIISRALASPLKWSATQPCSTWCLPPSRWKIFAPCFAPTATA